MLDLYKNIKKLRKENKLSQEELAKMAGYTDRSSIAKIESGKFDLPQSKILLFAEIFDVEPGVLMGNDGLSEVRPVLSADEEAIFDIYRKLNSIGKEKVMEYITDLSENQKYTKDTSSQKEKAI